MSKIKLEANREILYRGLSLPKVEEKTDNRVTLLPGANPMPLSYWISALGEN